jgi:drug/metabolite transporter (DMT)-like permease
MSKAALARYGAFAACTAIWGSTFLAIRIGNDSLPPLWAASLRLILATAILGTIVAATGQRLPRGAAFRAAFAYGFLVLGVNFCLLYWGEKTVPSGITAVLYSTIPLSTAFFARVLGIEALSAVKLAGAMIALAGTGAIFSGELGSGELGRTVRAVPLLGIVGGTMSASLGGVLLKRGPAQSALAVNAVGAAVGAVVCFVASTLAGEPHFIPRTAAEWFPVLYLTLAGSVVAFVLYAWLLKHWSATRASYISVIVPAVAVVLGALVLDERLTRASFIGTALILAGVITAFQSER